jgi:hypothetical protein
MCAFAASSEATQGRFAHHAPNASLQSLQEDAISCAANNWRFAKFKGCGS